MQAIAYKISLNEIFLLFFKRFLKCKHTTIINIMMTEYIFREIKFIKYNTRKATTKLWSIDRRKFSSSFSSSSFFFFYWKTQHFCIILCVFFAQLINSIHSAHFLIAQFSIISLNLTIIISWLLIPVRR